MPALIRELVNAAIDPQISVTSLLQRGLVAASRLNLLDVTGWINSELSGYSNSAVPDYRVIQGALVCEGELGGWMPLEVRDAKLYQLMTRRPFGLSIPEIERFINRGESLIVFFPPDKEAQIRAGMRPPARPGVEVQVAQIVGLIEQVRSRILQWALDLESKGILGEGKSFTVKERQIVAAQHYHFGDVTGSQIQIGSNRSVQSIGQGDTSSALSSLIDLLRDALARNEVQGDAAAELVAELKTLEAQAESPRPKASIIKETALSIQRVLEGTAANVLATAAPLIHLLVN
ncbi:hypothetical protein EX349_06350 [Pseudomonas protegens]|uniref:AbiTii domain-containing protein n=1 Tax=Pseudomonas protegens TaxID=380021 RepID=UPI001372BAEC|nr:hypothetical protein [Pseudomonas protegens]NUE77413.1 hypothetical protein [Pseudomonas protegens]